MYCRTVFRRRLYEKKGFLSIFEFAKKLAGLSEKQVRLTLNLEKRFEDKPILKNMLVNGEVSINKLVRIQAIATKENEEFWAQQIQLLPNRALETLVRDEKFAQILESKSEVLNGLNEPSFEDKSLHVQIKTTELNPFVNSPKFSNNELRLSPEVHQKLLELQQKGIDINQLLLKLLEKREQEIAQAKEQIAEEIQTQQGYPKGVSEASSEPDL